MLATATARLRHPVALSGPGAISRKSAAPKRRPAGTAIGTAYQAALTGLKLTAGVLAGATATLAVMNPQASVNSVPAFEPARNETVVYRRTRHDPGLTPMEASLDRVDETMSAYAPPTVQTIRFVNPDPHQTTFTLAAVERPMTKVGGFVAFPARPDAADSADAPPNRSAARPGFPRKRAITTIAEVDEYLWEVYQRAPIKKDRSGDFTWKDPAAAARVGLSLKEYVITGMDPDFREQLYHAGRAMDADGVQWAILSAFRDDYRQKLASGFKARGGNSLHGGSRRTGGFGHGLAVDVTSVDGDHWTVWKWLDAHGSKYGLHRPMPGNDPAHLQTKGDWRKLAQSFRHARNKVAAAAGGTGKEAATKVVAADGAKP